MLCHPDLEYRVLTDYRACDRTGPVYDRVRGRWATGWRPSPLPFGAGATKCIGEEFGLAEATLALATICACWKLTPEPGHTMSPAARAALVPRTLPMQLSARTTP